MIMDELKGAAKALQWLRSDCPMPAPQRVKWSVLGRYGVLTGIWVETGTYMGDTTAFLARSASKVVTIEPDPSLALRASARFAANSRVEVLLGSSEEVLPHVLAQLDSPANFWLDGHYSGGVTYKGTLDTPIVNELFALEAYLERVPSGTVLVDDFRCFDADSADHQGYPSRTWLVEWAVRNKLWWTVEQDIFVARKVAS